MPYNYVWFPFLLFFLAKNSQITFNSCIVLLQVLEMTSVGLYALWFKVNHVSFFLFHSRRFIINLYLNKALDYDNFPANV